MPPEPAACWRPRWRCLAWTNLPTGSRWTGGPGLPGAGETAYSPAGQLYVSVNAGGGLTVGAAA